MYRRRIRGLILYKIQIVYPGADGAYYPFMMTHMPLLQHVTVDQAIISDVKFNFFPVDYVRYGQFMVKFSKSYFLLIFIT